MKSIYKILSIIITYIIHTVYFFIQEIHGGAGSVSRIEYLTYIVEFETIHTEDLPSDWIIRLTMIDYGCSNHDVKSSMEGKSLQITSLYIK